MIQVPMVLVRPTLLSMLDAMSDEEIEPIAAAHPVLRKCLVPVGAEVVAMASAPAPGPAKAREPKASSGPTVDKASLDASVLACVAESPGQRSATIAAFLYNPARHGDDDKRFGDLVRSSLTRLVSAGKVYQDGTRKNARFKVAVKAAEPEEGAAE